MAFLNQVRAKSRAKLIQLSLRGFFRLADICILAVYIWPFLFLKVKVPQSFLTLCDPLGYSPPGSSPWGFSRVKNTEVGCHALLRGNLLNPGVEPRSSTLQVDSLPSEPPGKTKNTGMGSLSLLQGIFLTQELNQGLLHCRQILYQLSYLGNREPRNTSHMKKASEN